MANHVKFHKHPVLQGKASQDAGRPIYKDEDYIEIQIPGQKNQIVNRKVKEKDKVDYPQEWANYEKGNDAALVGTPIDHLPGITPSKVNELRLLGVHTIEAMADLSESGIQKCGHGARDFVSRAKAYLGQESEIDNLKSSNEELAKQNMDLSAKVDMLMKRLDELSTPKDDVVVKLPTPKKPAKKPGRPKKAVK